MKSTVPTSTVRPAPVVQAAAMVGALSTAMCRASYAAEGLRRLITEVDQDASESYVIGTTVPP